MNLFFLHHDPVKCAEYHCDKHVVKMIIELAQMMYTAHILNNSVNLPENSYRKISNHNHPTAVWVRKSMGNYKYCSILCINLCKEYTYRYKRIHKTEKHAQWLSENFPTFTQISYVKAVKLVSSKYFTTPVPLAMPDDSMCNNVFYSYRKYYRLHKKDFAVWTNRPIPYWFHKLKSLI